MVRKWHTKKCNIASRNFDTNHIKKENKDFLSKNNEFLNDTLNELIKSIKLILSKYLLSKTKSNYLIN